MTSVAASQRRSPWPHRLAIALALVTFPLIWVGGLVTTYDAGMAVPDWPGTFGYNLLLYPWESWLAAPWDLFIEHGHRLLGAAAGIVAVGLLAVVCVFDRRHWVIGLAAGALLLVIFQGLLGGARVLMNERSVALIHGCVGPIFFAYLAGMIVVLSPRWAANVASAEPVATALVRAAWFTVAIALLQLILGAVIRHVPLAASPGVFRAALVMHLVVAGLLAIQTGWTLWTSRSSAGLVVPAMLLAALVAGQLALGAATYVAKYSWPAWFGDYAFAASYVVQEKSLTQSLITTAHVATGSLILFVAMLLAVRATFRPVLSTQHSRPIAPIHSAPRRATA